MHSITISEILVFIDEKTGSEKSDPCKFICMGMVSGMYLAEIWPVIHLVPSRGLTDWCQQQDGLSLLIPFFPGWLVAPLAPPEGELLKRELLLLGQHPWGHAGSRGLRTSQVPWTQEGLATQFLVSPIMDSPSHFFSWPIYF